MKRLKEFTYEGNPIEKKPEWLGTVRALIEMTLKMGIFLVI